MILDLARQGLSISAIARRTGLDRKTVRRYIARGLEPPTYKPRPPRTTLLAPFDAYLRERVSAFPELTGRRLLREIKELGYQGGYSALTAFLLEIRPEPERGFERRFETPPGKQAQVDFAFFKTTFADEPGVERVVWLFSMVLGHSRMMWARFVARQDMQTVLRCHIAAFEALGGAPELILYDRMKTAVPGGGGRHQGHRLQRETPESGRPLRLPAESLQTLSGQDEGQEPALAKAGVERPFRYVREDFFLGRTFRNRDDLNAQFQQWLDQVANVRRHATTNRVVIEHFAEEKPHLKPLPAGPYNAVLALERRVTRDGMVSVTGNLYSVPNTTRRRTVEVQVTAREVLILEDGAVIACHPVLEGRGQHRVLEGHRVLPPPAKQHHHPRGSRPAQSARRRNRHTPLAGDLRRHRPAPGRSGGPSMSSASTTDRIRRHGRN